MFVGKKFRMRSGTLVLDIVAGKRVAVTIPPDGIIKVIAEPKRGNRMMSVEWEGRTVAMFVVDLERRGVEISKIKSARAA